MLLRMLKYIVSYYLQPPLKKDQSSSISFSLMICSSFNSLYTLLTRPAYWYTLDIFQRTFRRSVLVHVLRDMHSLRVSIIVDSSSCIFSRFVSQTRRRSCTTLDLSTLACSSSTIFCVADVNYWINLPLASCWQHFPW